METGVLASFLVPNPNPSVAVGNPLQSNEVIDLAASCSFFPPRYRRVPFLFYFSVVVVILSPVDVARFIHWMVVNEPGMGWRGRQRRRCWCPRILSPSVASSFFLCVCVCVNVYVPTRCSIVIHFDHFERRYSRLYFFRIRLPRRFLIRFFSEFLFTCLITNIQRFSSEQQIAIAGFYLVPFYRFKFRL